MADSIRPCIELRLSDEEKAQAQHLSLIANPANFVPPSPFEAAAETKWLWPNGSTLNVKFLDGDPVVQKRVEEVAHQWSQYANLKLDFGNHGFAHIRISFKLKGQSWSYVGTQSLTIFNQANPTMNFGWLEPDSSDETYSGVVLHEFGHALGLIHEHQNPSNGIPWDRDAVIKYYTGPPNNWTMDYVEHNVLNAYPKDQTQYSDFDKLSIMLYPIPNAHTKEDWAVDWDNDVLSATDKQFIESLYPFPPKNDGVAQG